MYIYPFSKQMSGNHASLEFPPDVIKDVSIWDKTHWNPHAADKLIWNGQSTCSINVAPIYPYNGNSLNPDNLGINLPNFGTLIFSHTPITAVLNPEDEEWYYNFFWGAAWYNGDRQILPHVNETTMEDVLLSIDVDFIEDMNDYPSDILIGNVTGVPINLTSNASSGNLLVWNDSYNYNWCPPLINIKI